jgi:hypothetical protein
MTHPEFDPVGEPSNECATTTGAHEYGLDDLDMVQTGHEMVQNREKTLSGPVNCMTNVSWR